MKIRETFLPYCRPFWDEDEKQETLAALESGWWSRGPKTAAFEKAMAEYVGAEHALALNSATAGLHIGLAAAGIGPGDEVITTPLTFCATVNTILEVGATPVFADIDGETGLIDPKEIERKISPRTRAVVPVHYAGQVCDMDRIGALGKKHNLFILEDAAHAVSSTYKGKRVGGFGDAAVFSFYATKNLATGEGGMLLTNNAELAETARLYSLHGMSSGAWNRYGKGGKWQYDVVVPGFKYNTTDLASALGLAQLRKLDQMQQLRREYAEYYDARFASLPGIGRLAVAPDSGSSYHLYAIRIGEELSISRDEFIEALAARNIGTSVHFIPVHTFTLYRERMGTDWGDFPKAETLSNQLISLPLYPSMTKEDLEYVADAVEEIARAHQK